jgi:hypothetical protein
MDDSSPDSCSLGVRAMYGLLENGRTDGFETRSHGQSVIESKQSKNPDLGPESIWNLGAFTRSEFLREALHEVPPLEELSLHSTN